MGQYISPSGLLRELPPHSSSSNIAGTSYVSSNLDNIFWSASVFWSNLIGETFPTALITQAVMSHWVNVWRCISDCAHVLTTGTPFHQRCLEAFAYALYQTGVREDGNLKLWWVVQHDDVTTLLLNIGTVQSSTAIHVYLFLAQTQLRYIYLLSSHHHSPTSSDLAIMITPLSAHTLEQSIWAPDFIHHIHQLRFVPSDCWTLMNNYLWKTPTPVVSRVPGTIGSCFKTNIWPHPKAKSCLYLS